VIARLPALAAALFLVGLTSSQSVRQPPRPPLELRLTEAPQPVYSADPHDSWNRIFYYLFSRRFQAYVSGSFPEYGPFRDFQGLAGRGIFQVSTRTFEWQETGDRPIDALYPSQFTDEGVRFVLLDPTYTELCRALDEALGEHAERTITARALMQSDLWSAFDILVINWYFKENGAPELEPRRLALLDRIGRLIARIALTPEQIGLLPNNSIAARASTSLTDLFNKKSGWIEIQWFPHRLHDEAAGNRRVTRVFLHPTRPPGDIQRFLNDFRKQTSPPGSRLDAVALAIQPLLIDTHGRLQPSNLTIDVQARFFQRTPTGSLQKTEIGVYEFRRQRLLREPASGGLVAESENDPAYASFGGQDFTLAPRLSNDPGLLTPLIVKLRTRCVACHGSEDLTTVMTFSLILAPHEGRGPEVRQLDPAAHQAAEFVISQKEKSGDWKALHNYFEAGGNAAH